MYGPGAGYNIFAGKDASKGLGECPPPIFGGALMRSGMSSLDPKDAIADYSSLTEAQVKTLDQWEAFFEKVGTDTWALVSLLTF
jgi:membrane-associated progesterone receptor component